MSTIAATVVPVFGSVALGYALARGGLFSADSGRALVRFMYYLAIPAMLFRSLAAAELPATMPWAYLAAFYLPSLLIFALAMLLARRAFGWARHETGIAGMSAGYANMVLLGFPLTLSAFGPSAALPLFILLATQSALFFPLTTWALERRADGQRAAPLALVRRALRLLLNPVIAGLLLGVAANLAGVEVPLPLDRLLAIIGAAAPGCALIALGISVAQYRLGGGYRDVTVLVVLKLLVHPLLVFLACHVFAVPAAWMQVAVLLAAMPSGINAFIFASQYEVRQEAVSKAIVISTALSPLVVTGLLVLIS